MSLFAKFLAWLGLKPVPDMQEFVMEMSYC